MPLIEVIEVSLPAPDELESIERSLDSPKAGQLFDGTELLIEGWIVMRDCIPRIEILKEGQRLAATIADRPRPDVASAFPSLATAGRSGFRATISVNDWNENRLSVVAVTPDGEKRVRVGEIRLRRAWREALAGSRSPLVSVVISSGRRPWLLEGAIAAVFAQTYPHFEIVLPHNRSSGRVSDLLSRYPGVRSIPQEKPGGSASRSAGLRRTVGDFVMFLDATDRLIPEALERGLSAFREHPECAAVFGHRISRTSCAGSVPIYRRSLFEAVDSIDPQGISRSFPVHCHHESVAESDRGPAILALLWRRLTRRR